MLHHHGIEDARPGQAVELTETIFHDYLDEHGNLAGGRGIITNVIDPASLAAVTVPPAAVSSRGAIGNPQNRIDIVVVGDGYTETQQGLFAQHADNAMEDLFAVSPFSIYRDYYNVHYVEVVSNESGVDHDPTFPTFRDTRLGMQFWCNNIERLLCVNVAQAYAYAAQAPGADQVIAIANSSKYGGAGYPTSNLGTAAGGNSSAPQIVIHELGHSLGDLADEYTYGGPTNYTGPEPNDANVSIFDAAQMAQFNTKWSAWLGENQPAYDGFHNTYEGGFYSVTGVYRPTNNSMMRNLGRPFNLPSAEALILKMYEDVDPIDSVFPASGVADDNDVLAVVTLEPDPYTLEISWAVNGVLVPEATGPEFVLASQGLPAGEYTVSVLVRDETPLIRNESARATLATGRFSWEVTVNSCAGDADGDGVVDTADITFVVSNLGGGVFGAVGTPGDANFDGICGVEDITFVVANLSAQCD
ncbi:MAG: M64 family metallopeptidase [Planctomycetota bacterium]